MRGQLALRNQRIFRCIDKPESFLAQFKQMLEQEIISVDFTAYHDKSKISVLINGNICYCRLHDARSDKSYPLSNRQILERNEDEDEAGEDDESFKMYGGEHYMEFPKKFVSTKADGFDFIEFCLERKFIETKFLPKVIGQKGTTSFSCPKSCNSLKLRPEPERDIAVDK